MRFLKKDPALPPPPEETRAESWNKLFCKQLLLLFCIFSPGERKTGGRRPGTWKKERKKFKIVPTFPSKCLIFLKDKSRVGSSRQLAALAFRKEAPKKNCEKRLPVAFYPTGQDLTQVSFYFIIWASEASPAGFSRSFFASSFFLAGIPNYEEVLIGWRERAPLYFRFFSARLLNATFPTFYGLFLPLLPFLIRAQPPSHGICCI